MKKDIIDSLVWGICITLMMLSIFIYGLIWLNKGYTIKHEIHDSEKYMRQYVSEYVSDTVMPAALKGRK